VTENLQHLVSLNTTGCRIFVLFCFVSFVFELLLRPPVLSDGPVFNKKLKSLSMIQFHVKGKSEIVPLLNEALPHENVWGSESKSAMHF
jgi:hypothetical protein